MVEVPFKNEHYDKVFYAVTLDRVVIDELGQLWILDYKTAKTIQTHFFQTDPQISAYMWIGNQLYDRPIAGFIYQQHRKITVSPPDFTHKGKFSTAQNQSTSHRMYRRALVDMYGEVKKAPLENVEFLNWLATQEDERADRFIRRDRILRNAHQAAAEGEKLLMELEEMLNPELPLYPSPTRDCGHMCSFNSPCVDIDDGSDWEYALQIGYRQKEADFDSWRQYII
jgi:hypothetical protein